MATLGSRLKKFRTAREMSQEAVARACDVAVGTYWRWESDTVSPSIENLKVLVKVLGITYQDLLD